MKKKVIVSVIVAVLFLVGAFSITISLNGFFFTTKYYDNPISAYNAGASYNAIYGETEAEREIGVFKLDEEKALFIGALSDNRFIVAEMNIKNEKYAYEGTVIFYDYDEEFDANHYNQTETKAGKVKWTIVYNKNDVEKLSDVKLTKEYTLSADSPLFFVMFEQ